MGLLTALEVAAAVPPVWKRLSKEAGGPGRCAGGRCRPCRDGYIGPSRCSEWCWSRLNCARGMPPPMSPVLKEGLATLAVTEEGIRLTPRMVPLTGRAPATFEVA